jgi:transcriptional regulator GlxA family with amidase domain
LRVRQVLNELENGQRCLRSLSAAYGFADQAHMTRVIRRHLRATPSALRDLLGHS